MQSQQKKVKWSRGETASALEERTDTGITEVSVALMENCMADIYGNISRRPGLKLLPISQTLLNNALSQLPQMLPNGKFFVFYISEDDYILFQHSAAGLTGYRIKNNVIVQWKTTTDGGVLLLDTKSLKVSQQNNYMILASDTGCLKISLPFIGEENFTLVTEAWVISGGWYAPNGTQTKSISSDTITGLEFNKDGLGFTSYVYNSKNNESTIWSFIDTGLKTPEAARLFEEEIPDGSIIQFPNNGAYMRYEGISVTKNNGAFVWYFKDIVFDGVVDQGQTIPATGTYATAEFSTPFTGTDFEVKLSVYENGIKTYEKIIKNGYPLVATETSFYSWALQWTQETNPLVGIYGPLLTPAAKSDAKDKTVTVEYGYISLEREFGAAYPIPSIVCFSEQRLWTGGWKIESAADQYTLVVGSQIAKYTDFKNDYNLANEAITLDILTKYKEDVLHLIDYNGLKIFTTGAEWAYTNGQPVKQSSNGALADCEPIVFGSLCLYADQTGSQIRAMQYEFQNNIFDSTIINQMTPGDLIWQPITMAQYEDKTNNTGRHLFVLNKDKTNSPRVATSNFVPGNQATIWSRWTFQSADQGSVGGQQSIIAGIVDTRKQPIFMINAKSTGKTYCLPAILDFDTETDIEVSLDSSNKYRLTYKQNTFSWDVVIANATVAVYSNGVYQYETTTDQNGVLSRVPTGLSNVTVGMPINARVVSHPIDVGGKTKTITKRIAKAVMSVRNTEPGAVTINSKTGYMNPAKDTINFYGVTGMKREIIYTITNNKGAKFTIESLTMNIEYGTLIS